MKNMLTDARGNFSWRKALTASCAIIFVVATAGFLAFGWRELPSTYTSVIAGVFAFYFTRHAYDKLGGKNNSED
jgi:cobalamin synthase